jgi:hypothetical protein
MDEEAEVTCNPLLSLAKCNTLTPQELLRSEPLALGATSLTAAAAGRKERDLGGGVLSLPADSTRVIRS